MEHINVAVVPILAYRTIGNIFTSTEMRKGKSTSVSKHRIAREHDHTHILVLALKTTTPTVVKCFIDFYCNDGIIKKIIRKRSVQ